MVLGGAKMSALDHLRDNFNTYWSDMEKCEKTKAYWALLHVILCLPDICAALQSSDGITTGQRYKGWCDKYLINPLISSSERYQMRCKVLHQGAASIDDSSRYKGFAFSSPAANDQTYHEKVEGQTLVLDVGLLSKEARKAVEQWIFYINSNANSPESINVIKNIPSLIQTRTAKMPQAAEDSKDGLIYERSS